MMASDCRRRSRMIFDLGNERDSKRSLTPKERQFLYENAKGRCANPACNKKITFFEMQAGHKKAHSKNGRTTLKNSVCLCYKCNHDQGNDSWEVFLKKINVQTPEMKAQQAKAQIKQKLTDLKLPQLKLLAAKHKIKVLGTVEDDGWSTRRLAPTKADYIKKLAGVVTDADIRSLPKPDSKPIKKKTRKKSDGW
jgi:hypothetical protein